MPVTDLNRVSKAALLYDFYSPLLTKKQSEVFQMYFMDDLSLSEIAVELGISRQAAGILINRTEKIMTRYESRLSLVQRYLDEARRAETLLFEIGCALESIDTEHGNKAKIINAVNNFLENRDGV